VIRDPCNPGSPAVCDVDGKPPVGGLNWSRARVCVGNVFGGWGGTMPVLYIILIRVLAAGQLWRGASSGGAAPRVVCVLVYT